MRRAAPPRLSAGLLLLTAAALATAAVFGIIGHDLTDAFAFAPVLLAFAVVGAVVARHRRDNPVGWLFLVEGLWGAVGIAGLAYARYAARMGVTLTLARWAAWAASLSVYFFLPLFLVLLLFPDGRLPSRRWRVLAWLDVAVNALIMIAAASSDVVFKAVVPGSGLRAPVRLLPDRLAALLVNSLQIALLCLFLLSAVACVARYRRSAAEVRHQIKWFAYAGVIAAVGFTIVAQVSADPVVAFVVLVPLVPIAAGVAIMKYRLYDIDVVISRTIVYGSLAAFITAVYVAIVAGIGSVGTGSLASRGARPDLTLSILATAVVAVAFQPVRERVQRLANRLVYGKRATPYEALSELAGQLGGTYATEDLLPQMARILAQGTGADRADVWLKAGPELRPGASWPPAAKRSERLTVDGDLVHGGGGTERFTLVRHQGEVLGALSVSKRPGENLTPVEDKLMADLGAQAGLIMHNAGLTEQLLTRLAELRASRQRIVAAQDDQRRRIERDIHDGAQQRLLGIAAMLAQAESVAGQDVQRERALVAQLRAETSGALDTLRELARGIYPPLLADQGLAAAVSAQAAKAPGQVQLVASGIGRYPEEIETAIYFCCVEALQNAGKHAAGAKIHVVLSGSDGEISFAVQDDGPGIGLACPPASSGLQHMSDRLAALGGSIEIGTRPGGGTIVAGRIPAAAALRASPG